jgi:hypothetical protein
MEKFYIYVYSVPPLKFINLAKKSFNFNLIITNQFQQANYIIGLESHLKNNRQILEFAFNNRINILYLYNNNNLEINRTLQELQDRIMLNSIL